MPEQPTLLPQLIDEMPMPDPRRPSPVVWVREIAVFKTLEAGREHEVRRVKLKPGLNILWARPEDESRPVRLNEPGLSGHAAGKTTFCRLVRHILGERHFANESVTRRLREKFDGGWILGEVFINDNLWLVGRPFTLGAHPFCVRGFTIDEYLERKPTTETLPLYLEELEKATVAPLSVRILPKSGEMAQWFHLLQWLTRDQECRFIQLTDWRSELSRSESPKIFYDDQHSLMRAVVGVLSEEERAEIEKNAKLVKNKENATAKVPILQGLAKTDHRRLEEAVGRSLPGPESPLLVHQVIYEALFKVKRF